MTIKSKEPKPEEIGPVFYKYGEQLYPITKSKDDAIPLSTAEMTKHNAVEDTLIERGKRYGEFHNNARVAQNLKREMHSTPGWATLSTDKKEALDTIQSKIARILNGDPEYPDNWHDIGGYAKLVEDRLVKK